MAVRVLNVEDQRRAVDTSHRDLSLPLASHYADAAHRLKPEPTPPPPQTFGTRTATVVPPYALLLPPQNLAPPPAHRFDPLPLMRQRRGLHQGRDKRMVSAPGQAVAGLAGLPTVDAQIL